MSRLYEDAHRALQDAFDTRRLADRVEQIIVHSTLTDDDRAFIEGRDMFFLSTVDRRGRPTCSYKGGDPGFVRAIDEATLAFPCFDGNGMFYSAGNIRGQGEVGMLFIDFADGRRLRLQGRATVSADDPLLDSFLEAQLVVRVTIEEMWINCPRYIHRMTKVEHSPYVPRAQCETPVPDWKRLPMVQDVLPDTDPTKIRIRAEADAR